MKTITVYCHKMLAIRIIVLLFYSICGLSYRGERIAVKFAFNSAVRAVTVQAPTSIDQESIPSAVTDASFKAPQAEITRRKNFAIISHPDAGKTTLTEKLLLFGGAIQDAGAVKARADQRKATSDWMEIEKQRGISVTSTVLSFEYALNSNKNKFHINLLDTPGHEDFSEDTYRTLAAADNVVMLIDAAKGIEDRTRKLFDVCKLRRLPIFTFVNKLDRPSQSPLDLIDQLEKEFLLEACPMNWPIGDGDDFQGVYDRTSREVHLFTRGNRRKKISSQTVPLGADLQEEIGDSLYKQLIEDIELLDNVLPFPDMTKIIAGKQSPLFFGSAMTSFGVELFLRTFLQYARSPVEREALLLGIGSAASGSGGEQIANAPFTTPSASASTSTSMSSSSSSPLSSITPDHGEFTGFVFKLQANLDPRHRDRLAFIRIVSGSYRKGMKVQHSRLRKTINLSQAQSLFAQERESVNEAYPGDVIGLHNPGHFAIGDTIFTGNRRVVFPPLPSFSPEKFAYIKNPNPSAYKKFQKGLSQLLDEGAVQILRDRGGGNDAYPLLAAVGGLQLEVVVYRLEHEYGAPCSLEHLSTFSLARWVGGGWDAVDKAEEEGKLVGGRMVEDQWGRPVLLLRNTWKLNSLQDEAPYLDLQPYALPPSEF